MFVEETSFDPLADENLGAMVIGLALSLVLFGVVVMQSYTYYQRFGCDRVFVKVLVIVVLSLEIMHSVAITWTIYRDTVTLGGVPTNGPNSYPLTTSVVLEVLITAFVQGFFAFRIYRLSGTLYISCVCWVLSLLRLGGGFAVAAESYIDVPRVPNTVALTSAYAWLITLALVVGAFVDVLIAASLCFYIKRIVALQPSKTTSRLVDGLITWTVQTGMITSFASVSVVIIFYIRRHTEIWFAIYMVTAKLYSNSFFVSLNLRRRRQKKDAHSTTLSNLKFQTTPRMEIGVSMIHEAYGSFLRSWQNSMPPKVSLHLDSSHRLFQSIDLEAQKFPNPPEVAVTPPMRR